jgi:alcohol dehydrogenase class IV
MVFPVETFLPQKTIFKKGASQSLAKEALEFGAHGLIVHGKSLEAGGKKEKIFSGFPRLADIGTYCRLSQEPELEEITKIIEAGKDMKAEWIAGIGGGSVLDLSKAAAGLFNAKEKPVFYQEGGKLEERGIPFIAIPTTCGTGSEATPNSVIINRQKRSKISIRHKNFLARTVILDVELLSGLPTDVLSHSAMDAYVQAYESFTSKYATWFSEKLALKAIELIDSNILEAYKNSCEKRLCALLLGSYFSGIAFSASRLGVIHGLVHPLGALYHAPHGLLCALAFIPSIKINRATIGEKYDILSQTVGRDFLERIEFILNTLNINSPLRGKKLIEKEKIIKETLASGSTEANPKKIEPCDIECMLKEIF